MFRTLEKLKKTSLWWNSIYRIFKNIWYNINNEIDNNNKLFAYIFFLFVKILVIKYHSQVSNIKILFVYKIFKFYVIIFY